MGSLEACENLSHCKSIEILNLDLDEITAEKISCLANLPQLQSLVLAYYTLTDDAFRPLARMENLKILECESQSQILLTSQHLQDISKVRSLEILSIDNIPITSAMQELTALKALRELSILTQITEKMVCEFRGFENLEVIDFSTTHMSLQGWEALHSLTQLKDINIHVKAISEEDLTQMSRFTRLEKLVFHCDNELTVEKVANLQEALPNTKIEVFSSGRNFEQSGSNP